MRFEIKHQMIRRTDDERIIAGNTDYTAQFTFSDDWDDLGKTAYFRNISDDHGYSMVLTPDKCAVPWEVLKKGFFTVTVYGGEAKNTRKRITTNTAKIRVFAEGINHETNYIITPYSGKANTKNPAN